MITHVAMVLQFLKVVHLRTHTSDVAPVLHQVSLLPTTTRRRLLVLNVPLFFSLITNTPQQRLYRDSITEEDRIKKRGATQRRQQKQ